MSKKNEKPVYDPCGDGYNPLAADGHEVETELLFGDWMADGLVAHEIAEDKARRHRDAVAAGGAALDADTVRLIQANTIRRAVDEASATIDKAAKTEEGRSLLREALGRMFRSSSKS